MKMEATTAKMLATCSMHIVIADNMSSMHLTNKGTKEGKIDSFSTVFALILNYNMAQLLYLSVLVNLVSLHQRLLNAFLETMVWTRADMNWQIQC